MMAVVMLLLILLVSAAEPQVSPAGEQDQGSYRISVNVGLVVLNATVRDRRGRFVPDLREQDFEVYEDGARQSLRLFRHEDIPVTVGLVIDHSGSMRSKLPDVINAARTFVQTSNPEDRLFVVNFNERVTLGLSPEINFTNRSEELERAISGSPATGMTALYDAVAEALKRLQASELDKKALLVISDGGDNASTQSLAQVLKMAEQSSALIYAIGIFGEQDRDRNPGVLNRLARVTGGQAFYPGRLGKVQPVCERIAREIRHQYTLGYVSTNPPKPGVFRTIRVVAHGTTDGKLAVRARSGYIAEETAKR